MYNFVINLEVEIMKKFFIAMFLGLCLQLMAQNKSENVLQLPFIDDFSYFNESKSPKSDLWMPSAVYINNHYALSPPSVGICTFDALDENLSPYNFTASSNSDELISMPIDLSEGSNIVFSFYFQAGGLGDEPEVSDSLMLFFIDDNGEWHKAWSAAGRSMVNFEYVAVKLEEQRFLHKQFQFKFVNKSSISTDKFNPGTIGNSDHWHIDFVYLDKNRNTEDSTFPDVAVCEPLVSLIDGYKAIPWKQMEFAEKSRLKPQITLTYNNLNNKEVLVARDFEIYDLYKNTKIEVSGGSENISAGTKMSYSQDILAPFVSTAVDSASFLIKAYITTADFDRKDNDTVYFLQQFGNFFARDDGTSESGYGFKGINANQCAVAVQFETFMPDTLRSVQLFFNQTLNNVTKSYQFKLCVWKDDNGKPGELIYRSSEDYSPSIFDKFVTYRLESEVRVTKFFWIGWEQVTSGFLNVGFDRNFDDHKHLFFNTNGIWQQDYNVGTLMIRPVFSEYENLPTKAEIEEIDEIFVYPNPAKDYIYISGETKNLLIIEIFDEKGMLLRKENLIDSNRISLSGLRKGFYIVKICERYTGKVFVQKICVE